MNASDFHQQIYSTLVSTELYKTRINDPMWVTLDCRYSLTDPAWGLAQYRAGHIPGAVFVDVHHDLAGTATGTNGRHPLPSPDDFARTLGRWGICRTTQVAVYDQGPGMYASRLWWMLRWLGHEAVAVIDGGYAKWVAEDRHVRTDDEFRTPVAYIPSVMPGRLVTLADAERLSVDRHTLFVDARSPERFSGQPDPLDKVPGHIPGARNRYYKDNTLEDGTFKSPEVLRAEFERVLGNHTPADTVMYCGSGITACHNLLAMSHAGLEGSRLYVGSWSEWEADPARPIERGLRP